MAKSIYIQTNGCAVVRHDTKVYSKFLRLNGCLEVATPDEADIILMTTCALTSEKEDAALSQIEHLKEKRPTANLIVGGCLPKINEEKLRQNFCGPAISTMDTKALEDLVQANIPLSDVFYEADEEFRYESDTPLKSKNDKMQLKLVQLLDQDYPGHNFLNIPKRNKT